jgi:hypothetical protein
MNASAAFQPQTQPQPAQIVTALANLAGFIAKRQPPQHPHLMRTLRGWRNGLSKYF